MIASAYPVVAALPAANLTRREHRVFICSTVAIALLVVIGFGFITYVRTRPGATAFGTLALIPAATTRPDAQDQTATQYRGPMHARRVASSSG
jgi:hypothetical protein